MPGLDGIRATRIIHAAHPAVGVIGLSEGGPGGSAEAMREAGAMDYLTKDTPVGELFAVLRHCYLRLRPTFEVAA